MEGGDLEGGDVERGDMKGGDVERGDMEGGDVEGEVSDLYVRLVDLITTDAFQGLQHVEHLDTA